MLSTISLGVILLLGFLVAFVDVRHPHSRNLTWVGWSFIAVFLSSVAVKGILDHNQTQSSKSVERQLQDTIDGLTNDVDALNAELSALSQDEAVRARNNDDGFSTLQRENEVLRAQVSSLESSNALLNSRIEDLTRLNDVISAQLSSVSATNDELLERNEEQSIQIANVQSELSDARSDLGTYTAAQAAALQLEAADREATQKERRIQARFDRLCAQLQQSHGDGQCIYDRDMCRVGYVRVREHRKTTFYRTASCE